MHYYMYRMHEYVDIVHSLLLCIEKIGPYRNIQQMYIFNAFCITLLFVFFKEVRMYIYKVFKEMRKFWRVLYVKSIHL
jgi:hypothetical protein